MIKKKLTAVLLTTALAISALAGCGSASGSSATAENTSSSSGSGSTEAGAASETAAETTSTEGITFPLSETKTYSMFALIPSAEYPLEDNISFQKLCEDTNIQFEIQSVLGADLIEKKGLVLASGDYPDVFFKAGLSTEEISKYSSQGVLIPLQDLIRQYAPNLTQLLDERNAWQYIEDADGNVYSLPEIDKQAPSLNVYWINQKWLNNLGLEEPKNLDELYNVLKAFKDEDANGNGDPDDEIPMTVCDKNYYQFLPYFGVDFDNNTKTGIQDGNMFYIPTSDLFKEFLAYMTRLYSEGLLDAGSFTNTYEQQCASGQTADIYGSFFDAGAFLTVGRDNDDDYIALTPFTKGTYPMNAGVFNGTLAITDSCEEPENIIAWADQLYSQEGGALAWLGIEGETYALNDDGTWSWLTDKGHGDNVSAVRASSTIQGSANHPSVQPDLWFTGMTDETDPDEVYLNEQRDKLASYGAEPRPAMFYSEEDSQTISTLKTDLDSYVDQYSAQVITGEQDLESTWDSYVSTMEQMGASKLESLYVNAYNATKQ